MTATELLTLTEPSAEPPAELPTKPRLTRLFARRAGLLIALWVMLASLYSLTYSGSIETGDTHRLFDAVGSLVDYGDQYLDLSAGQFPPQRFSLEAAYPLETAAIEPMQMVLAAPLYALAKVVPGIGLAHTTYLFNVFVGATIGSVLFLYALALGYHERTAALAAVVFGVGTALFPYTRSFFREPLMTLCLLVAGLCLERLRANGFRSPLLLLGAVLALLALTLTKASGLLALPGLVIIALPSLRGSERRLLRRLLITLGVIGLLMAGLFIALGELNLIPGLSARYDVLKRLSEASAQYVPVALHSYLLSIGGSFWGTSPVLLLALPGAAMLLRKRQFRYPLAAALLVLGFALGYALLNGQHWFGGLSWPPRFLIPVLPFVLLVALPALDWLVHHLRSVWVLPALALLLYSVWVQVSGVALSWSAYVEGLPPEASRLIEWGGGLNDAQYLRWVVIPRLWAYIPLDNAWARVSMPGIAWALGGLALACLLWLVWRLRSLTSTAGTASVSLLRRAPLALGLVYAALIWAGLRVLYDHDPSYQAEDESLRALLPLIERDTTHDDIVLLSTDTYAPFFLNYYKNSGSARVITLPLQPGEQPSIEQPPLIRAENPAALLSNTTLPLIHTLALTHESLWLVARFGPDLPWSTRPVERYLSTHYFPVRYQATSSLTRLVEYETTSAPDPFAFRVPDHLTDLGYGDDVRLAGFSLPGGTEFAPGDMVPVALQWQADAALTANYSVALFLSQPGSLPAAQSDWPPGGGFALTTTWQAGVPVWDNRALQLPAELPEGTYELWVKVYDSPGGVPTDLRVTGAETHDGTIGVLPIRINVRNR